MGLEPTAGAGYLLAIAGEEQHNAEGNDYYHRHGDNEHHRHIRIVDEYVHVNNL